VNASQYRHLLTLLAPLVLLSGWLAVPSASTASAGERAALVSSAAVAGAPARVEWESVQMVPAEGPQAPMLEVTVYRQPSAGRQPVVVINHGRSPGPAYMQERFRPAHVAMEFVRRGYAVVVPMRQGFSRSGGVELAGTCDLAAISRQAGHSVRRAVDWVASQPWADDRRMVVMGQSHGGLATLAYGTQPHPGTRLLVNVAGGLRQPACPAWRQQLVATMGELGAHTQLPSLWIYGDNDSHFPPAVWQGALADYRSRGGPARLHEVGRFGSDSHLLFGDPDGLSQWLPAVLDEMARQGLPSAVDGAADAWLAGAAAQVPMVGLEAALEHLPHQARSMRAGFGAWLQASLPKAFAISENGFHWASAWGGSEPAQSALQQCERLSGGRCRLFAVNGRLVWAGDSGNP
jgi:dienelactone hydrolase